MSKPITPLTFRGTYTAIITPFTADGTKIDFARLKDHIAFQAAGGVTGIVLAGTTGESPTLEEHEYRELITRGIELGKAAGLRVIAGTGSNSTHHACELQRFAAGAGADAALSVNPYYNKPTQDGLYQHFVTQAESADLPVMLYNIPGRTGVALQPETVERLSRHPNIRAVKEATGSAESCGEIAMRCPNLSVLSGDDLLTLAFAAVGAVGVVSVVSNLVPDRVTTMCKHFLNGDFANALTVHREIFKLTKALFVETNPIPVKGAMKLLNRDNGFLRLPMTEARPKDAPCARTPAPRVRTPPPRAKQKEKKQKKKVPRIRLSLGWSKRRSSLILSRSPGPAHVPVRRVRSRYGLCLGVDRLMPKPSPAAPRKKPAPAAQIESKPRGGPSIPDYDAALAYLYERVDLEKARVTPELRDQYKLDRMRAILEALDSPQESIRCVHVAGTKGKGSTCEMTATALEACGYTVGLFTSPHITDLRERIRLNRLPISPETLTDLVRKVSKGAAAVTAVHGEATFFELLTAAGFLHFAEEAVDVGVIEVGLGGKLDCTNVIVPEVAAITTIGHDHMQILGDTLEEIAIQKAGIFKPGVPALTVQQEPEVLAAMRKVAAEVGCPLHVVGDEVEFSFRFEWQSGQSPAARVSLTTDRCTYEHVPVPLAGEHQAINCGLALAILDKLSERGFNCPEASVIRGLDQTRLEGRFEQVLTSPRVIVDGAHNPESMRALMKALGAYLQYDSLVVLFGCAADKDIDSMLKALAAGADKVIFTQTTGNARAANPTDLARRYTELSGGKIAQVGKTFKEAVDLAGRALGRGDVLCITGSFYLVGEAKAHLRETAERKAGTAR